MAVESQLTHVSASGFAPIPKSATLADLIDKYTESQLRECGKTKTATLAMLRRELGNVKLASLNAVILRDFIDQRLKAGAGGVTISADMSYLSAVLKWGRHARNLDIHDTLAIEARASLKHRGVATRAREREREPTDQELERLYAHWQGNARQRIDMPLLCRFALATGMRQGEIARLQVEDIDSDRHTVVIRDRKDPKKKAGNDQTVPLLPDAWAIVEPLIQDRTEGSLFNVRAASVSTAFTRACQDVKPPILDLTFHDLRHRATAQFFRMELDIPRVALLTGHKTWTMLRRYTDIKPEDVHAAIRKPASPAPDFAGKKSRDGSAR
ncbi:site-specific integrase [Hydrogenophaga taeniospiralis]|uniref:tyrosine-type recombinase/integrase n=1 Tax=Hydrogenophaga taeniospiralis TaxID=65656 RepID=UPI001CF9CAFA|nr:site-specific integrase [Hydrogenophaga taeniospiralis]MCB4365733.1 site-specific integrase [Hydrogenophaga taeniospiralis]